MRKLANTQSIFLKMLKYEVKRFFTNKALLIIACVVPILLIVTLLSSLLPVLFQGAELNDINIALFNEDPSFETKMIVRHLTESDSVEAFVNVIEIDSIEEGEDMIQSQQVSAMIHIPENLQESLYHGGSETIYFYQGNKDKQIVRLLYDMLEGGLDNINRAQKSVDIVYYAMQDMGYSVQDSSQQYRSMAENLFTGIISRSNIYKDYNEVSATGDFLNIEYYLISTLLLCLFFLSLPICAKISKDNSSGVLDRGGFYLSSFGYLSAKVTAGSLYLLLPAGVTTIFILIVTGSFGLFSGSTGLLILTIIFSVIYFSVIMASLGIYFKSTTNAIWIAFSIALAVSSISGIFIPRELMPRSIAYAAEITGLPAIIRMYGSSLFGVRNTGTIADIIIIGSVCTVVFVLGYIKTRKRLID